MNVEFYFLVSLMYLIKPGLKKNVCLFIYANLIKKKKRERERERGKEET